MDAQSLACGCTKHDDPSEKNLRTVVLQMTGTFLGGALILNAFILSPNLLGGLFPGSEQVGAISALVGALVLALPLAYMSVKNLARGVLTMEELATLAILGCFALGDYKVAGIVAFFMLMAELIQQRTALGARAAIEGLLHLTPRQARVVRDGKEEEIQVSELKAGMIVRVRPGENVPADGKIVRGDTTINEATITGESLPADKSIDNKVFAGTANLTGVIDVEVETVGGETTLGKVRSMILQAEGTKIPIMKIMDRYIQWYIPVVLMIVGIILFFTREPSNAIAALVIVCPCAILLATPTAMVASLSAAARLGILVKNVSDLEGAGRVNAMVFDKTGTLTTGTLAVSRLSPAGNVEAEDLLRWAATAERHSNHPAAKAVINVADEAQLEYPEPENFEEVPGKGVKANVDGKLVRVGRGSWQAEEGVSDIPEDEIIKGMSHLVVSVDGRFVGWIGLEDQTREEARDATEQLQKMGIRRLMMLTGDRWEVARKVASELGCTDLEAECLPEHKLEVVNDLKQKGYRVAVVGDGVNDAPALAAGHIGIAMGAAGSDVAINSATIALMNNDLERLPFLMRLSKKTRSVVNQNLLFGLLFIVLGLSFAAVGYLTPWLAAFFHNIGSLIVIFNSARLARMGEEYEPFIQPAPSAPPSSPASAAPMSATS